MWALPSSTVQQDLNRQADPTGRLDRHVGRVGCLCGVPLEEGRAPRDRTLDDLAEIARSIPVRLEMVHDALEALEHLGWLEGGARREDPEVLRPVFEEPHRIVIRAGGRRLWRRLLGRAWVASMLYTLAPRRARGWSLRCGVAGRDQVAHLLRSLAVLGGQRGVGGVGAEAWSLRDIEHRTAFYIVESIQILVGKS